MATNAIIQFTIDSVVWLPLKSHTQHDSKGQKKTQSKVKEKNSPISYVSFHYTCLPFRFVCEATSLDDFFHFRISDFIKTGWFYTLEEEKWFLLVTN